MPLRGGLGSLEGPVHAGQWCAEGSVCSCVASEHANPHSGQAMGNIYVQTRGPCVKKPPGLRMGLQTLAVPLGYSTRSESSTGSFGDGGSMGPQRGKVLVGATSQARW